MGQLNLESEDKIMDKIKNIIFDMGNVLLRYDPWVSLHHFCKTQEEKEIIYRELFQGPEWVMADEGLITNGQRYDFVKNRVPKEMHHLLKLIVENWDMCMEEVPGAKEFVIRKREEGYGCFVLSNACNRFYHYFPRFYDLNLFHGVVVSSDVKMIKPNPMIYQYVTYTYGLKPDECLFIDDLKENVEAAVGVGMKGFLFQDNYQLLKKTLTHTPLGYML